MHRLITFDALGCLVRFRKPIMQIYVDSMETQFKARYQFQDKTDLMMKSFKTAFKQSNSKFPIFGSGKITSKQWWTTVVSETLVNSGVDPKDPSLSKNISNIFEEFTESGNAYEPFSDAIELLESLRKKQDLTIGIISNTDERLHGVVKKIFGQKTFDFILTSYEVGHAKPSPQIFQEALNRAKVKGNQAIHIGDNVELDYKASLSAGFSHAFLTTRTKEEIENAKKENIEFAIDDLRKVSFFE